MIIATDEPLFVLFQLFICPNRPSEQLRMVCAHLCTKRFHLIIAGEFAVFKSVGQRDMLMSQNNVQGKQKPFAFSGKTMNLQCSSLVESRGPLGLTHAFVERSKRCMLVKFFARKAAWLKFTAVNAIRPTPKTPRSCYAVIRESKNGGVENMPVHNI